MEELLPQDALQYVQTFHFEFLPRSDVIIWKPSLQGDFAVKSAYQLVRKRQPTHEVFRHVWHSSIPLKLSIFCWRLLNNLIPFPDILMDFGFQLPSKCPCCFSSDSVEHFFLHCTLARDVWLFVIHFFDLDFSLEVGLFDLFHQCWDMTGRSLAIRQICRLLPLIVPWALWCLRTRILFDGGVPALSSVLQNITGMFRAITGLRPVRTSSSDSSLMGCDLVFCRKLQRVVLPICWQQLVILELGQIFQAEVRALLKGLEFCKAQCFPCVEV